MRNSRRRFTAASAILAVVTSVHVAPVSAAAGPSPVDEGKSLAFDVKKGNCLACHAIEGGELAGNIGPALFMMKARYPDKERLRAQIFDASRTNPATVMPPFGRHAILTSEELNKIVEFVYTR